MSDIIQLEIISSNLIIAHLIGEIDSSKLAELEVNLKPVVENPTVKILVLHCHDLVFIDSKIVGFLAYLRTTFTKSQRELRLAEINETINDILSLVGLTQVIPCYDSLDLALK